MRHSKMLLLIGAALAFASCAGSPPETRQDNFREVLHGVEIVDPYRWLEDQESQETRAWIDAQNEYARSLLVPLGVREPIAARLTELLESNNIGSPLIRNGAYFFARKDPGQELWSTFRRQGAGGDDELLIDPHPLSPDHRTDAAMITVSDNLAVMAYTIRKGGEDETEIRFLDLKTKEDLAHRIPRHLNRGFAMKSDGSGCFYTVQDRETGPRVHYLDFATGGDSELFGDGHGPEKFINPVLAGGDRYLVLPVQHGWARTDLYFKDLESGEPVQTIVEGLDELFNVSVAGDKLVVQTGWEAPKQRVLLIDLASPARDNWKEIVPESADAIDFVSLAGGKLFVHYLHNASTRILGFTLDGESLGEVELPGLGSAAIQGDWDEREAVLSFASFNYPSTRFLYDTQTGERRVFSEPNIKLDSDSFAVNQVWYQSKDGTRVPMFLVHKKGIVPNGNLPTLLYGYGGFNASLTPSFRAQAALWVEQGGVYAVANLRGGGEFGDEWHRAGMLGNKQNVFDDFLAAAEWLIANNYTNPQRLAILGRSNGGLLVGAALTQRPDLFRAVLCGYPDLDMIGYYRFKNKNTPALAEYGDASKPEQFKFLHAYSPYQNVKPGTSYPAVLLTTGDADTRVPPLQARKMTARLQAATKSGRPVLLLYDTQSGHAGGRPLSKLVEDQSLEMAFLFDQLEMEWR